MSHGAGSRLGAGLLEAVWNRSDGRTGWCGDAGVRVAASPADAAAGADVVIMMLADDHVARSVGTEEHSRPWTRAPC